MIEITKNLASGYIEKAFKSGDSLNNVIAELRKIGIDDKTIQDCISEYFVNFNLSNKEDTLSDKNAQHEDWFGGPSTFDSSHWKKLCSILEVQKLWKSEMIESLDNSSNAVIKKLANPNSSVIKNSDHRMGLVLGYVQSGKTANYSAVIAKALDAGYKFVIVLSGIHNNLRYQTEARLRAEIVVPSELEADPITKMELNGDFNEKLTQSANRILGSNKGFGIAVLKKNVSVLRKFNKWISEAKEDIRFTTPVLIIDDESDQASINTSKDPEIDQTAINKQIRNIISNFKKVSYVGYTATPFANILIDSTIEKDLFPRDFIISLRKPNSYIGAEELFGSIDHDGTTKKGLPLVRLVDEIDGKTSGKDFDELPDSLKYAIDCFFISGALRISRGQGEEHISMLVHGSYLQADQAFVHNLILKYVRVRRLEISRNTIETINLYLKYKKEDFDFTSLQIIKKTDDISEVDFVNNLKFFTDCVVDQIILDNAASDKRLSFEDKFWGIVVGGNTLSRGLTIEGLTSAYFIRHSKMYDSLMQMGRWFGYRPGYLDLKRIFMTDELRNNFFEMASVENEIREEISVMAENNDRPIDLRIRIRQHPGMTVTAKNKMRTAIAVEYSFSGRRVQPRYLNTSPQVISKNEKAVFELLKKINKQGIGVAQAGFTNFRTSLLYKKIPTETILQFLDNYEISTANKRLTNNFIQNFIQKNLEIKNFNLAIMSQINEGQEYKLPDGKLINLINRSYSPEIKDSLDAKSIFVRGLAVPRDEMIDMYEHIKNPPQNVDNVVDIEETKRSFSYIRRKYRPRNEALLVIYPINSDSLKNDLNIFSTKVVWGLMFVFPEEKESSEGRYIVNSSV